MFFLANSHNGNICRRFLRFHGKKIAFFASQYKIHVNACKVTGFPSHDSPREKGIKKPPNDQASSGGVFYSVTVIFVPLSGSLSSAIVPPW